MDSPAPSLRPRVLALDVGKRRIGLAVSDPLGWTAQPLPTYERQELAADIDHIVRIIGEKEAKLLLIGEPKHLDGTAGRQAEYTRKFAQKLARRAQLPVQFWDERMTSVEATSRLREQHVNVRRDRGAVDQMAALLLLEEFLHTPAFAALGEAVA